MLRLLSVVLVGLLPGWAVGQAFVFGADLSYVNEMEDCGATYQEAGEDRDPYTLFADYGCNLVRLRLWHSPAWYDNLNGGQRYSDLADVRRSMERARAAGMPVLLNFHLSDTWADPANQVAPAAWWPVLDDLPTLQDSLYNYIYHTLSVLHADGLLPEWVQIGNETNRGILLSAEQNAAGWQLNWPRNAALFNAAIQAVRQVEQEAGQSIRVMLHIAGPDPVEWYLQQFVAQGVTDFDAIGLSYYWIWHQPTTIPQVGQVIARLRQAYPGKQVMVIETGYIWTWDWADQANNILDAVHPQYNPPSPAAQRAWLTDLTQEVIDQGGHGVVYWEPAWVSTGCRTPWGLGSHQENATFFDFNHQLLADGGIAWMQHPYTGLTAVADPQLAPHPMPRVRLAPNPAQQQAQLWLPTVWTALPLEAQVTNALGQTVLRTRLPAGGAERTLALPPQLTAGWYALTLCAGGGDCVSLGWWWPGR